MTTQKTKTPKDSSPQAISLTVTGPSAQHLMEAARSEAAKIFNVPARRVVVVIESMGVSARDPFVCDLGTYAQVDTLSGHAKCIIVDDPEMPEHDKL